MAKSENLSAEVCGGMKQFLNEEISLHLPYYCGWYRTIFHDSGKKPEQKGDKQKAPGTPPVSG